MSRVRDLAKILGKTEASNSANLALQTSGGGGSGVTNADSLGVFAAAPDSGTLHYALNTKALYIWDGSEYDRIYSGPNETLTFDSALTSNTVLNGQLRQSLGVSDSVGSVLNFSAAADFEGFPVTYSYQTIPPNPIQLDSAYGDDSGSGGKGIIDSSDHPTRPRITLMPSQKDSDVGDFIFRVKATDGTHVITSSSTVTLQFTAAVTFTDATASNSSYRSITGLSAGGVSTNSWDHDHNSTTSGGGSVVSDALAIGKKYMEVEILTGTQVGSMLGVTTVLSNAQGYSNATQQTSRYFSNGNSFGVSSGASLGAIVVVGNKLMIAWDTTARKVWWGLNGTWVGDPAAGTGGATLNGSAGDPFYLMTGGGSTNNGQQVLRILKNGDNAYTIPTGFTSQ